MTTTWVKWIQQMLDRAMRQAGIITIFLTLAGLGLGGLLFDSEGAPFTALIAFGVGGTLEALHRQAHATLVNLGKLERTDSRDTLFWQITEKKTDWEPKVFKQFQHGGVLWNAIGFVDMPLPITVAGPLCPRCQGRLTERRENRFPGRLCFTARCTEDCGFEARLAQPSHVLKEEANRIAGTPV
ncbi:hypothetical protein [Alloalcanivorax xenomutans]|uniref:hypothetical protein n=1 Tax=Alloalcanivorax xenomutans TaxID=1094342 RepID=UPI003C327B52